MNSRLSMITLGRAPETTYTQSAFLFSSSFTCCIPLRPSLMPIGFPISEIILTIGKSKTVEMYLKSAAHYHKFTVIVAESGPS